jgi:CheY-like chemotaxis protein
MDRQPGLLVVEDDDDDFLLIQEVVAEIKMVNPVHRVVDGEDMMAFLLGLVRDRKWGEFPGVILLDLNMPKKSGREALAEVRAHPQLRKIPVVIFTTSNAHEDISRSYELGVNSFIQKPLRFEEMVGLFKIIDNYWFKTVKLPTED